MPTRFPPLELTVIVPVALFINTNLWPILSVDTTGKTTVCTVAPVNSCMVLDATVNVVVPAAVAVVVPDTAASTKVWLSVPPSKNATASVLSAEVRW